MEAEERIRRINLELEKRVAERTADLTRSNEALRQFAWAASHDLQEPTRMVLTYGEWIARTASAKLDQQEMEMLRCVQDNGLRLQALLSALRQYIYISESGDAAWGTIDSASAVRTALSNLGGKVNDCGATVVCGPLPTIESVEILLVQLFQNLIGNAIKYRSAEPLKIGISAQPADDGWRFTVEDNGIGIEPQYLEYIFGVFKRLHGPQYSGTGIGLAICKAAVERLDGTIWVESTLGKGSAFHFELPRRPQ
ncbi:MAG: sensor histidine kinase [Bryobacteraceae bacterium]